MMLGTTPPQGLDPIRRIAEGLTGRQLETPAIFLLEAMKPFSVVTQQALFATSPLAPLFGAERLLGDIAFVLQDRQRMEELILALEDSLETGGTPAESTGSTESAEVRT